MKKLWPLPAPQGLSPQMRVTQRISDYMKGRTPISQFQFGTLSIMALISLWFCFLITAICFETCTNLVLQEKLNMAFQPHALYLTFWCTVLGSGQPRYLLRSLEDTSYPLHSQPLGYRNKMTPSFSNVTAQSFPNLCFWHSIAVCVVSCFMYHSFIVSHTGVFSYVESTDHKAFPCCLILGYLVYEGTQTLLNGIDWSLSTLPPRPMSFGERSTSFVLSYVFGGIDLKGLLCSFLINWLLKEKSIPHTSYFFLRFAQAISCAQKSLPPKPRG